MPTHHLDALLADIVRGWAPTVFDDSRRWSFGDVENNGVFYHPQLTHYAHQVFEQFFFKETGIQYADLSGRDRRHSKARSNHRPPITKRLTFPVLWLHQWMIEPMEAGDVFNTWIDTVDLTEERIAVRAHVFKEDRERAALVIWVRAAKEFHPKKRTVPIPDWFPRRKM
jgi:acyl-CoA thioesterase FadM